MNARHHFWLYSLFFLAGRTYAYAYATVLRPSVVCNVYIVTKTVRLMKKLSEEANKNVPKYISRT